MKDGFGGRSCETWMRLYYARRGKSTQSYLQSYLRRSDAKFLVASR